MRKTLVAILEKCKAADTEVCISTYSGGHFRGYVRNITEDLWVEMEGTYDPIYHMEDWLYIPRIETISLVSEKGESGDG